MKSNILIITNTPFYGGAEQFIVDVLSKLDIAYNIYYIVGNKNLALKLPAERTKLFKRSNILFQIYETYKMAKEIKADLLIFNGSRISYFSPIFIHLKKIYYRHTTNEYVPYSKRWLFRMIMNMLYSLSNITIHVSDYSLKEQKIGKGIRIYNGIKIKELQNKKESNAPLRILFCGRIEQAKGIREIVTAFNNISSNIAKLTIIGNGSDSEWVKHNILSSSIQYLGFKNNVDEFYLNSDALILMSEFENFPISLIEAMNYSLPIITTGCGGISEMVKDGYNGIIIKKDVPSLINAITYLNEDRNLLKKLGENAYAYCKNNLDVNTKIKEIHQVIETILDRR